MDKKDSSKNRNELTLEISSAIEGGVYSNLANIIHSKNEFIFDFAMVLPGKNAAKVQSRIVTNPLHAKQLLLALQDNIRKYEQIHGEIQYDPVPVLVNKDNSIH